MKKKVKILDIRIWTWEEYLKHKEKKQKENDKIQENKQRTLELPTI
jgi:hypothetical protein